MGMPVKNDRLARFYELTTVERGPETLEEAMQRVADGEGLPKICADLDVPYGRMLTWLMSDAKRYQVYLRALEVCAHREVQEAKEIADAASPETVGVAKLQVDTRFRRAKAHAKELYGDESRAAGFAGAGGITINVGLVGGLPGALPGAQLGATTPDDPGGIIVGME